MKREVLGTLEITAEDIARAFMLCERGVNSQRCPLAVALSRKYFVRLQDVSVHPDGLSVETYGPFGKVHRFEPTPTLRRFMQDWDRKRQARPARYRLYRRALWPYA